MRISTDARFVANVDGGVVLDMAADRFFGLDPVGAFIWKRIEEGLSEAEIVTRVSQECGAELEAVRTDVRSFLADLQQKGLVTV